MVRVEGTEWRLSSERDSGCGHEVRHGKEMSTEGGAMHRRPREPSQTQRRGWHGGEKWEGLRGGSQQVAILRVLVLEKVLDDDSLETEVDGHDVRSGHLTLGSKLFEGDVDQVPLLAVYGLFQLQRETREGECGSYGWEPVSG